MDVSLWNQSGISELAQVALGDGAANGVAWDDSDDEGGNDTGGVPIPNANGRLYLEAPKDYRASRVGKSYV